MRFSSQARSRVAELLLIAVLAASGSLPVFAVEVHRFDIPELEAAAAIREFAVQAHVQILVAGEAVNGKKLHAVTGELSTEQGINALLSGNLLNGFIPNTNFTYTIISNTATPIATHPVVGQFAGLPPGGIVFLSGVPFKINYAGGALWNRSAASCANTQEASRANKQTLCTLLL